ncbi:MAG: hypothetical protein A2846_00325 [Candidatus Doudnabacteria bacterium RIFCSPHIGHO2_01_FULL_49_9]|uniref:Uncharacterized protein n=1 Tax=Candidatus Doudnabacteria bacterium RIFCSPHIGHO2_01_FULL_49_9 TaxID=1817827 RepID=A0A1F5P2N8_9BACT|nr:MAG: hypothetical protein A2846_00325 [Candidatus Doudnabacteria bacterium RIFCSPHIGHO2_01_FULL_49_9]
MSSRRKKLIFTANLLAVCTFCFLVPAIVFMFMTWLAPTIIFGILMLASFVVSLSIELAVKPKPDRAGNQI